MNKSQLMDTDEELKQHLLGCLALDTSVNTSGVDVSVSNGAVTLHGTVPCYADKVMTAKAASCVTGVEKLVDEVTVVLPATRQQPDCRIAETALNAIKCVTTVPTDRITVTAQGGRLVLGGSVDCWSQKEAVEEVVRTLTGVTSVLDTIAVQPYPLPPVAGHPAAGAQIKPGPKAAAGESGPASSGTLTFVWRPCAGN